jgi:hypothetical protein
MSNKVRVYLEFAQRAIGGNYKLVKLVGAVLVSVRNDSDSPNRFVEVRLGETMTERQAQELVDNTRKFEVSVVPA